MADMTHPDVALDHFVRAIEREGLGAHSVHIRIGADEAGHRWVPDVAEDIHSIAKAVCVLAAAIASDEGVFDLDAPVVSYLPTFPRGNGVDEVTVRHLLTMTSGIDLPYSETMFEDHPDLARAFLRHPSRGRVFQYSNASTYTAMRALDAVVGDVGEWLVPRLFEPLGIESPRWDRCPNGWITAGGGLWLRTDELARIGRLLRDRGVWDGRRLIGAAWIDAMHADWVNAGQAEGYDRYALAGWAGPGTAWRLHGAHGQLLVFEGDAVVTVTAHDHVGGYRMAEIACESLRQ